MAAASPGNATVSELPLDSLSDAALVAALCKGSARAASAIWQRYSALVRRTLCRSLGPDQELDDLMQDVFIGFVKSAPKLEAPGNLKAYLVSIAFRTAAMEIRRRKVRRWVMLTSTGEMVETPAPTGDPDHARALRALYKILDSFSARDRMVFVARHIEGMQIDETAAALQLSKATVWRTSKSTLQRVVARAQEEPTLAAFVAHSLEGKGQ